MLQRLKENKDLFIVAIASFFIGFGAASFFGGSADKNADNLSQGMEIQDITLPFNKETTGKAEQPSARQTSSSLMVENQRAGSSVLVKKAGLSEAQWIVIRDTNNDGTAGNILGAGWFPPGMHENVSVPLLRETTGGEQYMALLYSDTNGDKQFDHQTDAPVKNVAGDVISVSFSTVASPCGE
ncbi:MAG: hypothetical protein G01um101470_1062 [Parcubacteria group bacterium Gr01-1014_70]|nr:MAG: hypothetical protein G01um101470_1062 [Parcubacteria group bacterium Gr01-1014_70]